MDRTSVIASRGRILGFLLLAFVFSLSSVLPARADGIFFKDRRFPVPPPIPAQRALIVHRDGKELLVVESTLDADGQTFGWILPVPAKPTSVQEVTAGALDTLDLATRPKVLSDGSSTEVLVILGLVFVLVLALRLYFARRRGEDPPRGGLESMVVLLALLGLLFVFAIPNLGAGRLGIATPTIPGVLATEPQRVGNYEVTVLEARDAGALGGWLEKSGLAPVPPAGKAIVDDYIAGGWVFVAVRLVRDGAGLAAPHPLAVAFPSEKPVYPMRLTALAGGTTDLRIHVVAAGSAEGAPLEARFSGMFEKGTRAILGHHGQEDRQVLACGGPWEMRALAHPFLLDRLWDGCVVTRLEGAMAPRDMDRDLVFTVGDTTPRTYVLYTPAEAWRKAMGTVAWFWALALFVLLFVPDSSLPALGARGSPFIRWVLVVTVVAGGAVALVRIPLPKIPEAQLVTGQDPFRLSGFGSRILRENDGYAGKPLPEVRAFLESKFRAFAVSNPYTGKPIGWGDSPGGFQLLEDYRGPVLRVWSLEGAPIDRPWFTDRIEWILYDVHWNWPPGGVGAEEVRKRLFPDGAFIRGLRNPFTGEPVRQGRDPGNAEVVEENRAIFLRIWFREGKSCDYRIQ
jgi:hypothetical protein